jgi:hypothetical protein
MNNAYFLLFKVFEHDWQKEMKRFCDEFELAFAVVDNGQQIRFTKRSS